MVRVSGFAASACLHTPKPRTISPETHATCTTRFTAFMLLTLLKVVLHFVFSFFVHALIAALQCSRPNTQDRENSSAAKLEPVLGTRSLRKVARPPVQKKAERPSPTRGSPVDLDCSASDWISQADL